MIEPLRELELLLVEDNPGDARLIRDALEETHPTGVRLRHARSLDEALVALSEILPSAVLLDLHLGDSAGMDTLERVLMAASGVPVVVLSGLGGWEAAEDAQRRGAEDFIGKDVLTPSLLTRVLRHALARAHAASLDRAQEKLSGALLVARTAAHEINNALSPISGYAELLAMNPAVAGDPQLSAYVARIAAASENVAVTVRRLQHVVRIEERTGPLGSDRPLLDIERSID